MTETAPAGWYPDPANSGQQRYWDGIAWTDNFAPGAAAATAPTAVTAQKPLYKRTWFIVVAVLIGLGVIGNMLSGSPSATPEPAPSTAEVVTPPSKVKSEPAVAEPDPEPEPDPVPEPAAKSPSSAERAYAMEVIEINSTVGEALSSLGTLLTEDPTAVFYDDDTRAEAVVYMATVKAGYVAAQELDPPTRMEGVHADFLAAMKLYDRAMDKFAQGVDEVDEGRIGEAIELMTKANEKLMSATAKIESMQQ